MHVTAGGPATTGEGVTAVRRALRAAARAAMDRTRPSESDRLDRRDPELVSCLLPALQFINSRYFRLEVEGVEHIPRTPALFAANHNGGILGPDLAGTMATLWTTLGPAAPLYAMAHDLAMVRIRPFGRLLQRLGGLRAARRNAFAVLSGGGQLLVYPGGELDAFRHASRQNEIVFGRRTGFIRVAQDAGVPIVPIVAQGAHRSALILHEGRALARLLRLDRWGRHVRCPVAVALPWGIAFGPWLPYLPLPCTVRLRFLPPIHVPAHADPAIVQEGVRTAMQQVLRELARRESSRTARTAPIRT